MTKFKNILNIQKSMGEWKKIEALLFASGKYLTEEQLIVLAGIPKNKIKKVLEDLKKHYEETDTSLKIFNEQDAWKLNVKEEYTETIREVVSDAEMPRAVMETLAVIAYKTPVLQSEIKDIRGVSVYDHIPLLEAKGFITREKHGRSYKIKLTNKFHEYFDIEGENKLAEMFKDIKKPDLTKLGTLDVYNSDDEEKDDTFDAQILERMKKLEKTKEDDEDENKFLNEFDEKYEKTKKNIDESEQDIQTFKRKTDEDTQELFEGRELKRDDDEDDASNTETDNIIQKNLDDEDLDVQDDAAEIEKEPLFDENGEPVSDFAQKINKQIDDLVGTNKNTDDANTIENKKDEKENLKNNNSDKNTDDEDNSNLNK